MRRLPPLNPLKVFEVAARHQHFANAAQELCVTVSAVSHQIKILEDSFGIKLFEKQGRNAKLTLAGKTLLPSIQQAFDIITEACEITVKPELSGRISISAPPEISSKFLIKKMGEFAKRHPMIDVNLLLHSSDEQNINTEADLSIIYGAGQADWDRYWVSPINRLEFFPVCSPALLVGNHPLRQISDLQTHRLLHDDQDGKTWATWLGAHAPHMLKAPQHMHFAHTGLSLEAAILGYGVALGDRLTTAEDLTSGRLVRPFSLSVPSLENYYLVAEKRKKSDMKLTTLIEWLLEEML